MNPFLPNAPSIVIHSPKVMNLKDLRKVIRPHPCDSMSATTSLPLLLTVVHVQNKWVMISVDSDWEWAQANVDLKVL